MKKRLFITAFLFIIGFIFSSSVHATEYYNVWEGECTCYSKIMVSFRVTYDCSNYAMECEDLCDSLEMGYVSGECTFVESSSEGCYCCGSSQGCNYTWYEGTTPSSSCYKVDKTEETCTGSSTDNENSLSGTCYACKSSTTTYDVYYVWETGSNEPTTSNECVVKSSYSKDECSGIFKYGETDNAGNTISQYSGFGWDNTTDGSFDCGLFSDIVKPIAIIIMIIAPILVIILGTIDFLKAVAASDEKAMKKAFSDVGKRLLIAMVILLLPVLINTLMGWINFQDLTACW